MTRENNTVNPKAGTLKQENRALRTKTKSITVKLIAFALFILVSIPNMSFVQDDTFVSAADSKKSLLNGNMTSDSCCLVEKPGNIRSRKGVIKLVIPSVEMIRKSDSEATSNLVYSLKESKLKALMPMIAKSDAEINKRFRKETSLDLSSIVAGHHSDKGLNELFAAENISINALAAGEKADTDINDLFIAEHVGIPALYVNLAEADLEINKDFALQALNISLPSASQFNLADTEIMSQIQQTTDNKSQSVVKSGKSK
jgi:hypothetical protein